MLTSLLVPIVVCAVALFIASAISWTVSPLHKADWKKLPHEEAFMKAAAAANPPLGSFMFPGVVERAEANAPEFKQRYEAGPRGVVTFLAPVNMGRNLGLTFLYYLVTSFCLAYLATLALPAGADGMRVFRFVATAGLMTYLSAILCQSVWFGGRVVGHVIESALFAAIAGGIFAALWPKA